MISKVKIKPPDYKQKERFWRILFPDDAYCFACGFPAEVGELGLCFCCAALAKPPEALPEPPYLDGIAAPFEFGEPFREPMHRLKYGGSRHLARSFANAIAFEWDVDCVVPVPLHPKREKLRGYNQSALIAKALSKRLRLAYEPGLIIRTRDTQTQTELTASERNSNMLDAFSAPHPLKCENVLLVDDVCTTGSTLDACAKALKQAGAKNVYAVCACAAKFEKSKNV
ncbi:ComF family protein [Eubacteriales bacterium OttesenSCG-928-K08]|nr:ComF family protein [Eubacteriales bacterium OttesenSCG-928-K08]